MHLQEKKNKQARMARSVKNDILNQLSHIMFFWTLGFPERLADAYFAGSLCTCQVHTTEQADIIVADNIKGSIPCEWVP